MNVQQICDVILCIFEAKLKENVPRSKYYAINVARCALAVPHPDLKSQD